MIHRRRHLEALRDLLRWSPVVAILGARQIGKTTLARQLAEDAPQELGIDDGARVTFFDLEDPTDLAVLDADPKLALADLRGLVVIDEVQRRPDLFPVLRVLVDRPQAPARFLILGSASPELLRQSSETLAGRIVHYELGPLALDEAAEARSQESRAEERSELMNRLWFRGGFPRSLLAGSDPQSVQWRRAFVRTFLERDIPALGITVAPATLDRFWAMLAHYHGETWNGAEMARAFGMSSSTVRRYLDILTSTFVVRQLRPWHANLKKRQVKAPKIYLRDTGLLHTLLQIDSFEQLQRHPKIGASWEGFALDQVMVRLGAPTDRCYFWATHGGAELDFLVRDGDRALGFEIKRTSAPKVTRSMRTALEDLELDRLDIIYPGSRLLRLAERVRAVPLSEIWREIEVLDAPL
ncbi:MAG: ATP-binding protein [Acidobacteriota bacterium]